MGSNSFSRKILIAFLVSAVVCTLTGCEDASSIRVGCTNNTAGMLVNYAISHMEEASAVATDGFSSYMVMDCCSPLNSWSLAADELDAAVMCPDAAAALVQEDDSFLIAGPLTYGTEVLCHKADKQELLVIGYMSGQERQKENLLAWLGEEPQLMPVLATSLNYALSVDKVDAAVLDIANACTTDYTWQVIEGEKPTAVLVVKKDFYNSAEYPVFLNALADAQCSLTEYDSFCEAMTFLFPNGVGRKEFEKWQLAAIKFPVPEKAMM